MSRQIKSEEEFQQLINDSKGVFVMVYPSWCHFSLDFLPIFEHFAADKTRSCARVIVDDLRGIDDRYDIDVYPTVLYFKDGKRPNGSTVSPGSGWTGISSRILSAAAAENKRRNRYGKKERL